MKLPMKIVLGLVLFLLFIPTGSKGQFYTGSQHEFGKSRVQYEEFAWQHVDYQRFRIYFNSGGRDLAQYVSLSFYQNLLEIEAFLDFQIDDRLELILYNSHSDFKQTNIGITDEVNNIGGRNRIVGNKIFLYYEGDHQLLEEQIRAVIAEVVMKQVAYGGDWKDVLKANTVMSIPEWYMKGFVSYISKGWSPEIESKVKDGVLTKSWYKFNNLEGDDATLAGHAIWFYIEQNFGRDVIPNIIYLTRASKNIDRGFLYVLGVDFKRLSYDYIQFYRDRFKDDLNYQEEPDGEQISYKLKKRRTYYHFSESADGRYLAYVTNDRGKYKIWIKDQVTDKSKVIYRAEPKLDRPVDLSFPVIGWHPLDNALIFFTEKQSQPTYNIYTVKDKELTSVYLNNINKILSFDYSPDGKQIVVSGVLNGQTDLYIYKVIGNVLMPLTSDIYDDLDPRFANNNSIVFASNRKSDTIFKKPSIKPFPEETDIFVYQLSDRKKPIKVLKQLTKTPNINERSPMPVGEGSYVYLSDQNGLNNRYFIKRDSVVDYVDTTVHYRFENKTYPVTNYVTTILEHQVKSDGTVIDLVFQNGKYKFFKDTLPESNPNIDLWNTSLKTRIVGTAGQKIIFQDNEVEQEKEPKKLGPGEVDINNYQFLDDEQSYEKETITLTDDTEDKSSAVQQNRGQGDWEMPNGKLYKLNFARDYIHTQIDNNYLDQTYQRYSPGAVYFNPGLNFLVKLGLSDVFEDYKLMGGIRIPINFNSGEQLIMLDFLKHRLDHRIVLHRQTFQNGGSTPDKWKTNEIRYRMSYPFNEVFSIRGTFNYRHDRNEVLAIDDVTLAEPKTEYNTGGAKVELVFDNSRNLALNLWQGAKMKIFGEYLQEIDHNQKSTFVVGADIRYSIRIFRNFVWVNRLAYSTSFGGKQLLYYLGGVDSWMLRPNPSFNNNINIDPNTNWAYQTVGTPMRGFIQNTRNGNSFALINSELRFPLFQFFSASPLKSDFLRHFQVIGFGDVGAAWTGPHPYSEENHFNTQYIDNDPITIELLNQREPIVGGVGFGLRSKLLGYFVRFDLAWGIENGQVNSKAIPYFSLALDL